MAIDRIPIKENPQLFDKVIADIQKGLADNLNWLNYSFGRAERLVKMIGTKRVYTPNIYVSGNDYLPVSPDSTLGNFSFFVLDDPQNIDWQPGIQGDWKAPFSLIFWFNMRTITDDVNNRDTESIKAEILRILNGGFRMRSGKITINKVYERAENIYQGFTLDEVDNQFLMHPYAGFRFTGEMFVEQPCLL